jgi:cobaltochelatase CobS
VPAFSAPEEHVPPLDPDYVFDRDTTLALLAGFVHNRRVMVQGRHGTGKSSHVEQVASRLNWPCVRVNLDGHVSRMDLIGKDAIVVRDGKQVTEFQPGMLTWALQRPCALVFDEYDAGRADVMFVIQRVLEVEGRLTLLDQSRVIEPHPRSDCLRRRIPWGWEMPAAYHGTPPLNQGQMDRWNIVVTLNYLEHDREIDVVLARCPEYRTVEGRARVSAIVALANLTRRGFVDGDLSTLMSPRTVVTWAQNTTLFHDPALAFKLTFLNRCDEDERALVAEYYQRCIGHDLPDDRRGPGKQ